MYHLNNLKEEGKTKKKFLLNNMILNICISNDIDIILSINKYITLVFILIYYLGNI